MKLPGHQRRLHVLLIVLFTVGIAVASVTFVLLRSHDLTAPKASTSVIKNTPAPPSAQPTIKPTPSVSSFDKTKYSHTDPTSLWVVVNKQHPLNPKDYVPADIISGRGSHQYSSRLQTDLGTLIDTAAQQGITISVNSAYRSYASQTTLFNGYVAQYGQATAETISAKPGYSEHQTGLAIDIAGDSNPNCNLNECFGDTTEGKWLAAHANEFGFVIRYQKETTSITGYAYEPWHIRYVGRELAAEYKKDGATSLESFFGVTGGAAYSN